MNDYFNDRRYVGRLSGGDLKGGKLCVSTQGAADQGALVELQLHVVDDVICDVRYLVYGSRYLVAAMAYAADWLMKKPLSEARTLSHLNIKETLELPTIQTFCAVLVAELVADALPN